MSDDLRTRLEAALGTAYRIERELGGGGMSRVFLAEEVELRRKVVVKVLPPEMAAGVNQDRFRREIQLAAGLQHPHIVPVHSAGSSGDLLWYTMPFIEGESLRTRLARGGELPVKEALQILREVADALAYAHGKGVVHRDIKPDNVMLSGKHALVTDFGVAKAVSESTGKQSLTSLGVALGTPSYMAPEQAAAEPNVDHRADLYALGAMAYEMLAGRPPFSGMSAQAVLAAHVTQTPEPVTAHRPAIPAALGGLVMRCLEKRPADRWQTAEELVPHLEALLTPSGGTAPTMATAAVSSGTEAALERRHPVRVAGLFAVGSAGALSVTWLLVQQLGLPDWVVLAAGVLLLVGLPIVLIAARKERQQLVARTQGLKTTTPTSLTGRLMTLRGAIAGGGLAFLGLALGAGAFMALRAAGVGPFATLVSAGVLSERDRLVVADFANTTPDSTLGPSITEAFRIDLAQSSFIRLLEPDDIKGALTRMSRDPATTALTADLAREVAEREGARGVIAGEVGMLAGSYALSVRLLAPDGTTLLAGREIAADAAGIIPALEKLSRKLREGVGESLRTLRTEQPLEQVTTGSLEALRLYTQSEKKADVSDYAEAARLLTQALAIDSGFAMAWRKLAVVTSNMGGDQAKVLEASEKAFRMRDRLSRREAELATAYYFNGLNDRPRAIEAYERVLASWPDDKAARNNLGLAYSQSGRYEDAERVLRPPVDAGTDIGVMYSNLATVQLYLGRYAAAETTVAKWDARLPGNSERLWVSGDLAFAQGGYDRAARHYDSLAKASDLYWRVQGFMTVSGIQVLRGRPRAAEAAALAAMQGEESRGIDRASLVIPLRLAMVDVRVRSRPEEAAARIERALARKPLASMSPVNRPYGLLIGFYATVGNLSQARTLLAEYERTIPAELRMRDAEAKWGMGRLAVAEQRYAEALQLFRASHELDAFGCRTCRAVDIGETFDRMGQADSALAAYGGVATLPAQLLYEGRDIDLPIAYQRLGELYESKGDKAKALEYYGKFVDLWKDADPELQPRVAEIRKRIGQLAGEPGAR
jgi:tetratricopeptide (TPR) repeat protein